MNGRENVDAYMVAEDAKRVERAAIDSGKSISDFVEEVLRAFVKAQEAL